MNSIPGQSKCWAESGYQLLARLDSRPSLAHLEPILFDNGPNPNDIIEISGDVSTGKTLLVTQLLAKCLLPKISHGINIGGLNAGAILINTDHHFQITKLANSMLKCIEQAASNSASTSKARKIDYVECIVKAALDNLIILHCYDNTEFIITFYATEKILSNNKNISLLVLDSISSFYWQNTVDNSGIRKMDYYLKRVLHSLHKHIKQFKITTIYTKPSHFQSKYFSKSDDKNKRYNSEVIVSKKINLEKIRTGIQDVYTAQISSNSDSKIILYEFDGYCMKWQSNS